MTAFTEGQLVRARVAAQGLVEGDLYRVASVSARAMPFGDFVTYYLYPVDSAAEAARNETFAIGNGHLVLEAAEPADADVRDAALRAMLTVDLTPEEVEKVRPPDREGGLTCA